MTKKLIRLTRCTRGATAVEYGFIVGLIVVALMAGINAVGGRTSGMWNNMAGRVAAVEPT